MENPLQPKNAKAKSVRVGIAGTLLTVIPALAFAGYIIPTIDVNAASDSDLCVTATRDDDATIVSKRGWCEDEVVAPSPTATVTPTATPTATVAPTAEPVVTPTPDPTPTPTAPVNHFASFTWTSQPHDFRNIAVSADGKLMALSDAAAGDIYISTDSGATWVKKLVNSSVAHDRISMSPDGTKIITNAYAGGYTADSLWVSTNSGNNWTKVYTGRTWSQGASQFRSVRISNDGNTMIAQDTTGYDTVISRDQGATWKVMSQWLNVEMSGDAKILYGGKTTTTLYKSVNGGTKVLMPSPTATSVNITAMRMSNDGNTILVATPSSFHVSRDGGSTWEQHPEFGAKSWTVPNVSHDGTKMTMLSEGKLYVSVDSGASWSIVNYPVLSTTDIMLSPDGSRITATSSSTKKWWVGK